LRKGVTKPAGVAPVKRYLAHVRQNKDGSFATHNLEEHLRAVADLAGEFASTFGHSDLGQLGGLWHDIGKYSVAFQGYIARGNEIVAQVQRTEE
jgi:HD superfamily phosphodiesterase